MATWPSDLSTWSSLSGSVAVSPSLTCIDSKITPPPVKKSVSSSLAVLVDVALILQSIAGKWISHNSTSPCSSRLSNRDLCPHPDLTGGVLSTFFHHQPESDFDLDQFCFPPDIPFCFFTEYSIPKSQHYPTALTRFIPSQTIQILLCFILSRAGWILKHSQLGSGAWWWTDPTTLRSGRKSPQGHTLLFFLSPPP